VPVKGFVAGQGAGKSKVGAYDLCCRARAGRLYMVTAPTYKMLRDSTSRSFTEVASYCGQLLKPLGGEGFSAWLRTADGGKAEVLFRSTEEPDHLRGPNLSGLWMDEASLSPHEAYQIGLTRLREAGEMGWLTATFTPKGRTHWTYEVFALQHGATLIRARTDENPFVAEKFVEEVSLAYVGLRAQQELGGEFITVEGAEWPPEYFPDSMWFDDWPNDLTIKVMSLDPSKGKDAKHGDYSALVKLGRDRGGMLWCEADMARRPTSQIVGDSIDQSRGFQPDAFGVEVNQFQELLADDIAEQSQESGIMLPIVPIDNRINKQVRIRRIGPLLARGAIRFRAGHPGTELLVMQLREFPEGNYDDGPDALEMALRIMTAWLNPTTDQESRMEQVYF
jgi:predicted phage terminase large subunit-like protein